MTETTPPADPSTGSSPDYVAPEGRPGRTGFWLGCLGLLAIIALALAWQLVLPLWRRAQFLDELQKGSQTSVLKALREYEAQRDPGLERAIATSPWQPSSAIARKVLETDSEALQRALIAKGWRPKQRPSDRHLKKLAKLGPSAMPIMLIAMQNSGEPSNSYCAPAGEFLRKHDPTFEHLAGAVKANPSRYGSMLIVYGQELAAQLGRRLTLALMRPLLDDQRHANSSVTANGKTYQQRICDLILADFAKLAGPGAELQTPMRIENMADPEVWEASVQAAKDWWSQVKTGAVTVDAELGFVRFNLNSITTTGERRMANILIDSKGPKGADTLNLNAGFEGRRYVEVAGPVAAGEWRVTVTDKANGKRLQRTLTVPANGTAVFEGDFTAAEAGAEVQER